MPKLDYKTIAVRFFDHKFHAKVVAEATRQGRSSANYLMQLVVKDLAAKKL